LVGLVVGAAVGLDVGAEVGDDSPTGEGGVDKLGRSTNGVSAGEEVCP
jgi:hypothetical protein